MSLFACERCNCVENTALTGGSIGFDRDGNKTSRLCSRCHDGRWHDEFPRERADNGNWRQGEFGLERIKLVASK